MRCRCPLRWFLTPIGQKLPHQHDGGVHSLRDRAGGRADLPGGLTIGELLEKPQVDRFAMGGRQPAEAVVEDGQRPAS
jgi:hypothetical protein